MRVLGICYGMCSWQPFPARSSRFRPWARYREGTLSHPEAVGGRRVRTWPSRSHTFGGRIRDEILPLSWDRVNLDALMLRLDPASPTKNREGREVTPGRSRTFSRFCKR